MKVYCNNDSQKDILLVGINPFGESNGFSEDELRPFDLKHAMEARDNPIWKYIYEHIYQHFRQDCAFIDLFPYLCKTKTEFNKWIKDNHRSVRIHEELRRTQREIEEIIRPKIILLIWRNMEFYLGADSENPWLGYTLKPIDISDFYQDNNLKGKEFSVYRITGYQNTEKTVGDKKYLGASNLVKGKTIVVSLTMSNMSPRYNLNGVDFITFVEYLSKSNNNH